MRVATAESLQTAAANGSFAAGSSTGGSLWVGTYASKLTGVALDLLCCVTMITPIGAPGVRDMHATFESLFNGGDVEGLVALYEPDAILNASPEAPASGKDAIRVAIQGFLAIGGTIRIATRSVFEGEGIALTHGDWTLKGGATELAGRTAEVLRRQPDGRWLYVIDNPWA